MKKIVSLLLAAALCLSLAATALAEPPEIPTPGDATGETGDGPQAEQTKWFYRTTEDGLIQKRLWSWTYMKWLTDWITIGHVV